MSPRVTIGMPVYNGERYIKAALDSILAQTFTDFEVVISDNASTDRTAQICRAYTDRRVKYFHQGRHTGAAQNYNKVFSLSSSTGMPSLPLLEERSQHHNCISTIRI